MHNSDSTDGRRMSLLEKSMTINDSSKISKFNSRKLSSVSIEDEEILIRSASMYEVDRTIQDEQSPVGFIYKESSNNDLAAQKEEKEAQAFINFNEIAAKRKVQAKNLIFLNIASYVTVIVTLVLIVLSGAKGSIFDSQYGLSPLALNEYLKNAGWILVFILKGVFAIFPLLYYQEDFNETVIFRIRYSF